MKDPKSALTVVVDGEDRLAFPVKRFPGWYCLGLTEVLDDTGMWVVDGPALTALAKRYRYLHNEDDLYLTIEVRADLNKDFVQLLGFWGDEPTGRPSPLYSDVDYSKESILRVVLAHRAEKDASFQSYLDAEVTPEKVLKQERDGSGLFEPNETVGF